MRSDTITWFEIPARDIDRATRFYEGLLGTTLRREAMMGSQLAVFPSADGRVGGSAGCCVRYRSRCRCNAVCGAGSSHCLVDAVRSLSGAVVRVGVVDGAQLRVV